MNIFKTKKKIMSKLKIIHLNNQVELTQIAFSGISSSFSGKCMITSGDGLLHILGGLDMYYYVYTMIFYLSFWGWDYVSAIEV